MKKSEVEMEALDDILKIANEVFVEDDRKSIQSLPANPSAAKGEGGGDEKETY